MTIKKAPTGESASTADIEAQLARILASPEFANARRQQSLLSYLVGESLAGRGDRIKATSIAIDVFGRDGNFDQQRDTIVRVEAGRLRRRLEDYYRSRGPQAPLLIEIPKGGYRPRFVRQHDAKAAPGVSGTEPPQAEEQPRSHLKPLLALLLVAAVFIGLLGGPWSPLREPGTGPVPPAGPTATPASARPFLIVLPFELLTGLESDQRLGFGLSESLITSLSKLSGLSIMAHASILDLERQDRTADIHSLRDRYGVTHAVRGSIARRKDAALVSIQLVDTRSGEALWADQFPLSGGEGGLEENIALGIASQLSVQVRPEERVRLASAHSSESEAWVLYRQGLVMLMPPNDMTRVTAARQLFRRAQEMDPRFAGGYAGESFSHSVTVLFLKTTVPDQELARALPLAERAIAVDPGFGMGYAVRSFALLLAGSRDRAMTDAGQATAIQPGDAFAQFIRGMNLIITGQADQAIPILDEALRLDPLESRTPYLNVKAIALYASGDSQGALAAMQFNDQRSGPRGPHMDVFRAAALAHLGRLAEARDLVQSMLNKHPGFPAREWLQRWMADNSELLEQTIAALEAAGLPPIPEKGFRNQPPGA